MEYKILSINKRHYPTADSMFNPVCISTVLVAGDIGDYAAYSGCGDPQWVARFGDKLSFNEACCHFPIGLERDKYRD